MFGSGYLANLGIIPALVGARDLILIDELAHACLWAGARLSRATVVPFRHTDVAHVGSAAGGASRARHQRALIATDGVFSMDGDLAPLPALAALAQRHDAWLMTDDAHGLGVIGGGRGSNFVHGVTADVPLQMGTLSKALGAYGGYLCASAAVDRAHSQPRAHLVYSTGLAAGDRRGCDRRARRDRARSRLCRAAAGKAKAFARRGRAAGAGKPDRADRARRRRGALAASRMLEDDGFLVVAIRPPTVPVGTARLRLTFTARTSRRRDRATCRTRAHCSLAGGRDAMTAIFITATGTDIGKTFVTAALDPAHARAWPRRSRRSSRSSAASTPDLAATSDPGVLLAALGRPVARAEVERISPWRFTDAAVARHRRHDTRGAPLIPGGGRVLPPAMAGPPRHPFDRGHRRHHGAARRRGHTVLDWMSVLRIPIILVAGTYLGTISHTLTSLDVLARRNLDVAAVVVSESAGSGGLARGNRRDACSGLRIPDRAAAARGRLHARLRRSRVCCERAVATSCDRPASRIPGSRADVERVATN